MYSYNDGLEYVVVELLKLRKWVRYTHMYIYWRKATIQSKDEEMSAKSEAKQLPQTHSIIHNYSHNTNNIVLSHQSTTIIQVTELILVSAGSSQSPRLTQEYNA